MSQYVSTSTRVRTRSLSASVRATAGSLAAFARACADRVGDEGVEWVPSSVELRATAERGAFTTEQPLVLEALVEVYGTGAADAYAIDAALDRLALDERDVIHATLLDALDACGFDAESMVDETGMSRVWASRFDGVMAIEVAPGGGLELDYACGEEDACGPMQVDIVRELAARGVVVELDRARIDRHGDPEGGRVFQRWYEASSPTTTSDRQRRRNQGKGTNR
jgi:hypothetical protein